ncbi:MAG: energy transducer TonB [Polaribacter sp.]|nr:energy transducer TonB [Polaribacter sp.]
MKSKFKISIPKPCNENWNTMTPKEKGRFCSSCDKTVVDFTEKTNEEIQYYLVENKNQRVCGHFYKKQLDSIVIEIPPITFQKRLSFQKLFILALFLTMGTTLFSCQYPNGKRQKIENIVFKDAIKIIKKDSVLESSVARKLVPPPPQIIGITMCKTNSDKDSIIESITSRDIIEVVDIIGEIVEEEEDVMMGFIFVESARFKESKNLNKDKLKNDFNKKIQDFIKEKFEGKLIESLGLSKGKYKIQTQFTIDKKGNVTDIKIHASNLKLKEKVYKILQKLPQFIPGKQAGRIVKTKYNLPLTLKIE